MELHQLGVGDRDLFSRFIASLAKPVSDMGFASLLMWREVYDIWWGVEDEHLCVFSLGGEEPSLFFPPIGPNPSGPALDACRDVIRQRRHHRLAIEILREEDLPFFTHAELTVRSGDYIYETKRMITLEGGALSKKRQNKNAFLRKYPDIRCEPYTWEKFGEACVSLIQSWSHQNDGTNTEPVSLKRQQESTAATELLRLADILDLPGLVLFSGETLVGVTIGELLQPGTFVSIIEKTDRHFMGSAQYIFSEFCARCWSHTQWCNACDDWDVPSLAYTKQSYDPAFRIAKWRAVLPL